MKMEKKQKKCLLLSENTDQNSTILKSSNLANQKKAQKQSTLMKIPKKKKSFSGYRGQRSRNLYDPLSTKLFKISRSKLELFLKCARCFYIDRRLGVGHPPGYPFSLNVAVDALLKKEFDRYRDEQRPHPLCIENGLDVIPFKHDDIERWRDSLHAGVQYVIPNINIMLHGGLDDVWIDNKTNELIVVDYKATSKKEEVSLDAPWQIGYKRQAEIYQWLLRKNGFEVSDTAYFVYCNGKADKEAFNKQLFFDISLLPYKGDDSWVETAIIEAYECLKSDQIPSVIDSCDYCIYWMGIAKHLR